MLFLFFTPYLSTNILDLQVEVGNPNLVWSASEDGVLRQHDFREGASCPPVGSSSQECRNILISFSFPIF